MSIERVFEKAKAAALARWRGWAAALADGGTPPDMADVVAAGSVLGIEHAAAELERDAAAVLEVRHLEQEAELVGRCIKDRLTDEGGPEEIRKKLSAARREVERLERLVGTNPLHFKLSSLTSRASTLRRSRSRMFPPVEKKATPQAPRRKPSAGKAVSA